MKKSKIIKLVLISATLASCSKYDAGVELTLPDDRIALNTDSLNEQKKSELFINLQENTYKLWQYAFCEKGKTTYNTKNYLTLPRQENSFKVSYPVNPALRGGFGLSGKSAGA